jgi:hypothetical protein
LPQNLPRGRKAAGFFHVRGSREQKWARNVSSSDAFGLRSDVWEVSMEANKSCLERAFEIARSGRVPNFPFLVKQLKSEGYGQDQVQGPALKKQLNALIEKARAENI